MTQDYDDQKLNCSWNTAGGICGSEFVWTAKDQEFYAERGFTKPKYCREHREARRAAQQEREGAAPQQDFQQGRKHDRGPRKERNHSDRNFLEDGE